MHFTQSLGGADCHYTTEVNSTDAIVSVFIATHGYEQGRIYFVVTCPNIDYVHTCSQFAVVPFLNF